MSRTAGALPNSSFHPLWAPMNRVWPDVPERLAVPKPSGRQRDRSSSVNRAEVGLIRWRIRRGEPGERRPQLSDLLGRVQVSGHYFHQKYVVQTQPDGPPSG